MNSKPTILLMADDFNSPSGIGTQSFSFIRATADKFNWVQLAAAKEHPDAGKRIDMSEKLSKEFGVEDLYIVKYPHSGYGDPNKLREILHKEDIDAVMHFTDPRYWEWLYLMEHEIHIDYNIPIIYYAIWDNLPFPYWNIDSYASCDLIAGISKQSHLIHKTVLDGYDVDVLDISGKDIIDDKMVTKNTVLTSYVPHGIDTNSFFPINEKSECYNDYLDFEKHFRDKYELDFVFYWANRNIGRKNPSQLIAAFGKFVDEIPKKYRDRVGLVMHTIPVDPNGTDLPKVHDILGNDSRIVFIPEKLSVEMMNYFYNVADVTVNIASNEGFGLTSAESLAAGTPVINTVTGGLQDQMRFEDDNGNIFNPTVDIPSNHTKTYEKCGEWAYPVFPACRTIKGSVKTPYIFDDLINIDDLSEVLLQVYNDRDDLDRRGLLGREWICSEESMMNLEWLGMNMSNAIQICLDTYKSRDRYQLINTKIYNFKNNGVI